MATNGYSKILPAIASGITQTEFLSLNYYEEEYTEYWREVDSSAVK